MVKSNVAIIINKWTLNYNLIFKSHIFVQTFWTNKKECSLWTPLIFVCVNYALVADNATTTPSAPPFGLIQAS